MAPDHSDLNWDDLKYFLAVARAGSLRGGAALIDANHATVSRRIGSIEAQIGTRLFDRSSDGLALTVLGEELLPHAERVEDELTSATRLIAGQDARPAGSIAVSMPHAIAMTSIVDDLTAFSDLYPDIDLHLHFSNDIVDLSRREADVSLRVASDVTGDVVGRKLVDLSAAVYCTPEFAQRFQDNGGEGVTFVGWMEPDGVTAPDWLKDTCYPKARIRHRAPEVIPTLTLAAAGLGATLVSCCLADRHPGLIRAPFQHPIPRRSLWLLLHRDLRRTARVRLFVDFLAARITSRKYEFWVPGTRPVTRSEGIR